MATDKIYRINPNDTNLNKITNLNDMIIYLNGLVLQGKFDINELDHVYSLLDTSRKYVRNQGLGNTISTYTGWTHLKAEDGYSIWYYTQSDYAYNALNQVYFDGAIMSNKGQADSESATAFDKVFVYDGSTYIDFTAEASSEGGTEFNIIDNTGEYIYTGLSTTFAGQKFEWKTRGSNYNLKVEYWSGGAWTQLTANANNLSDETSNFESDGRITWDIPTNWVTNTVNSVTKYWIRISTVQVPVTTGKCYYLIPGNSVIALLALSSTEIIQEYWAWCSCSTQPTRIYVTIRNAGAAAYEGDYYINSSSSSTNKENFFVHNHPFTADYLNNGYDAIITKTGNYTLLLTDGTVLGDTTGASFTLTLPTAVGCEGKRFCIKKIAGANNLYVDGDGGETIDGKANRKMVTENDSMTVESDGTNWRIIAAYTEAFSWSSSSSLSSSSSSSSYSFSSSSSSTA